MSESNNTTVSIGFPGLLALLFIALKLTGYIAWSWWWVLSPLWIPALVVILILIVVLIVAILVAVFGGRTVSRSTHRRVY